MQKLIYMPWMIALIICDQLSKWAITQPVLSGQSALSLWQWLANPPARMDFTSIPFMPFMNIVMVWNQGVSFGLFSQDTSTTLWLLIGLTSAVTIALIIWLSYANDKMQQIALTLIISGAIGNLIDRFRFGAVIDFIDIHAFGWHWPAFNIADSLICIGAGLLLAHALFFEAQSQKTLQAKEEDG